MRPQLIMACFGIFIIGTILSVICSTGWMGAEEISIINQLAGFSVVNVSAMGGWGVANSIIEWFSAFVTMITWSYPYLDNVVGWIIKLVLLYPITIGVVVVIVDQSRSVIQGLATAVRTFIP